MGGMGSQLQAVGALAMMSCANPSTKKNFAWFRVLSPVAVSNSYAGVIIGNLALTALAGVAQGCVLLMLRWCQPTRRVIDRMAAARFPSILVSVSLAFHTGTAFASARILSQRADSNGWEIAMGAVGFAFSLALPAAMSLHPYLRVERAFQSYELEQWLQSPDNSGWFPRRLTLLFPTGALYSLETRRAYGSFLSAFKAPPRQLLWTSLPTWTPLMFLVAGLFDLTTVWSCRILLISMGTVLVIIAGLVLLFAPFRARVSGWLEALSRLCLGGITFAMAAAIAEDAPANDTASNAVFALSIGLMLLTSLRVLHVLFCVYIDRRMEMDAVPLTTVWMHTLNNTHKGTNLVFTAMDEELEGIATFRDASDGQSHVAAVDEGVVILRDTSSHSTSSDSLSLALSETAYRQQSHSTISPQSSSSSSFSSLTEQSSSSSVIPSPDSGESQETESLSVDSVL